MLKLLMKLCIKDRDNLSDPAVRAACGTLCGALGIFLNLLLFAGKFIAGTVSGSMAVTADAFNNLSDAGSSAVSMIGFRLSSQKPDPDHPFGHGRFEYIASFIIAVIIMLMGFELGKSSVDKILHPEAAAYTALTFGILCASILVKLYMYYYNSWMGKKLDSAPLRATAADSLSDCISTGAVLLSALLTRLLNVNLDGIMGLVVALLILRAGFSCARDTVTLLLGTPPEAEFVQALRDIVLAHDGILGIHDLIVHNYGPGRQYCSLHAEVPADGDMLQVHDLIDNIEWEIFRELGCQTTIHMDPVEIGGQTAEMKAKTEALLREIDPVISFHDFRMVSGHTHTNLIFDVVVPFGFRLSDEELKKQIDAQLRQEDPRLRTVITVDKDYVKGVR